MDIPQAALQNYQTFRNRGSLGPNAERYPIPPEATGTMESQRQVISDTASLDNQPGADTDPRPGMLTLEDDNFVRQVQVQGDSDSGSLTELARAKSQPLQSVSFIEATPETLISYQAYLSPEGQLQHAWAFQLDQNDPSRNYAESWKPA